VVPGTAIALMALAILPPLAFEVPEENLRTALLAAGAGVLALAVPLAAGFRHWEKVRLRRCLEGLSPTLRAEVLLPLQREKLIPDARKILVPLLRDMELPTELAPAGTPEGSGAEVSGAD
jgi:hypothetical protein